MNRINCSSMLENARKTEAEKMKWISPGERPAFHLTPPAGWMNDPNGFSFYNGQYHLFFNTIPMRRIGTKCTGDMRSAAIC